jgi:hypothetical protein
MNTEYYKARTPDRKHELRLVSGASRAPFKESAELQRLLEQVRKALIRLESELTQLEAILDAAHLRVDQDEQERIQ